MLKLLTNLYKMKKKEIELKLLFYTYALDFVKNKESIISSITTLIKELGDTDSEEIKQVFISRIAELVHENGKNSPL